MHPSGQADAPLEGQVSTFLQAPVRTKRAEQQPFSNDGRTPFSKDKRDMLTGCAGRSRRRAACG